MIAYAKAHGVNINLVTMLMEGPNPGSPSIQSNARSWATKYTVSPVLQADGDAQGPLSVAGYYLQSLPAAFPTTLLISPQGKILDFVQGVQSPGALQSRIMGLTAGQVNFFPPFSSAGVGSFPQAVGVGDNFEYGNEPDLVVANAQDGTVSVLSRNSTNTGYNAAQTFPVGSGPIAVATGVLFNPGTFGDESVVTANYGIADNTHPTGGWNDTISVLSSSTSLLDTTQTLTVGQGPAAVAIGDVNGDGLPDIVVANNGLASGPGGLGNGNTITVLLQNSAGTGFLPAQTYTVGNGPNAVAIGDLNGDGWPDVVVANQNDGTINVLYGDGQGGLGVGANHVRGGEPLGPGAG